MPHNRYDCGKKNMKILSSLLGSVFALLLATSCCWLPWLAVVIGSSIVGVSAFSAKLEAFSGMFMVASAGLLGYAGYSFWKKRNQKELLPAVLLQSLITCPQCGFSKMETMPTNACQFFYDCENCKAMLKPLTGDCCVFCSYGTVKCPPMQGDHTTCC